LLSDTINLLFDKTRDMNIFRVFRSSIETERSPIAIENKPQTWLTANVLRLQVKVHH
jgi:hypothetical protein